MARGPCVLVCTIDLGPRGVAQLRVCANDDPALLAVSFVREHGLPPGAATLIRTHILANLAAASRSPLSAAAAVCESDDDDDSDERSDEGTPPSRWSPVSPGEVRLPFPRRRIVEAEELSASPSSDDESADGEVVGSLESDSEVSDSETDEDGDLAAGRSPAPPSSTSRNSRASG